MKDANKVRAAKARAEKLTGKERSEIARHAAFARHSAKYPKAIAEGELVFGELRISCAVLDDSADGMSNTRVLTQGGFLKAIGRAEKAKGGEGAAGDGRPAFLRAKNLEEYISDELLASTQAVEFVPLRSSGYQGRAFGYKASLLPQVCWVYNDAHLAGDLLPSQIHIAESCRRFLKALTNYAIEDLVDKATGYEDIRKQKAINAIIEKFVEKDHQPWVKMFDLEFYRQVYRLNGWPFDPENTARPGVIGKWTNDIYERLAPGVKQELHARVKRNENGKPTQKLTQYLTPEEGRPKLRELLAGVILLMRMSKTWDDFRIKLDEWYPRYGETMQLPFETGEYHLPSPE